MMFRNLALVVAFATALASEDSIIGPAGVTHFSPGTERELREAQSVAVDMKRIFSSEIDILVSRPHRENLHLRKNWMNPNQIFLSLFVPIPHFSLTCLGPVTFVRRTRPSECSIWRIPSGAGS